MNKKIIICCDGTWNEPEDKTSDGKYRPTNVLRMVRAIKPTDEQGVPQVVLYIEGVGTGTKFNKFLGGATGIGIAHNIKEGYRFLANNYQQGDKIYLFGFSRGAYTARSLCGLINTVHLLPKDKMGRFNAVYEFYRTPLKKRESLDTFTEISGYIENHHKPKIHFIGVWDTVGSLGAPTPMLGKITKKWVGFHDTKLSNTRFAYHALAIDERRGPFAPSMWTSQSDTEDMRQVWFCGAHSDIGGGYPEGKLCLLTFEWMAKMAKERDLALDYQASDDVQSDYQSLLHNSHTKFYTIGHWSRIKGLKKYHRPIGAEALHRDIKEDQQAVFEKIHQSAQDRYFDDESNLKLVKSYNSNNLESGVKELEIEPY